MCRNSVGAIASAHMNSTQVLTENWNLQIDTDKVEE